MNSKNNAFSIVFGLVFAIMGDIISFANFVWLFTKNYSLLCSLKS